MSAQCNGICLSGWDIGMDSSAIAYAHSDCDLHGHPRLVGKCLSCGSVEVELNVVTANLDLSDIGESDAYPAGYGCEVCS